MLGVIFLRIFVPNVLKKKKKKTLEVCVLALIAWEQIFVHYKEMK